MPLKSYLAQIQSPADWKCPLVPEIQAVTVF